ncbi:hypothetical protein DEO72_LG2g3984 [Vigna unguiculata]|uniref:Uncharacterized protein n=1 Tax=Vigna unguiculata TaxID=3917 RepID=A0A4D6L564_VIGUN|nr:hypothetical protein DEO72_LG2g3984 [Vigna unguiculata]
MEKVDENLEKFGKNLEKVDKNMEVHGESQREDVEDDEPEDEVGFTMTGNQDERRKWRRFFFFI